MSYTICPLFSGSEGNCTYIEDNGFSFLVDAGRSTKQIESLLMKNHLNNKINFILVTHEHSDHTSALQVFCKRYKSKVYGSKGTIEALYQKGILVPTLNYEIIDLDGIDNDKVKIIPFDIPHDCAQGFGYSIFLKNSKIRIAICSDIGHISENIIKSILGADIVFIESNHDLDMLKNGPYPYVLKRRILSENGHLSNLECSNLIPKLVESGTSKIVLCHLSSNNNTPEIAYKCAISSLEKYKDYKNIEIHIAPKFNDNILKISC